MSPKYPYPPIAMPLELYRQSHDIGIGVPLGMPYATFILLLKYW
jgi:hypothetical protein